MAAQRLNALAESCFMCLVFFGPVACSLALLHLIASYWAYFDIGINATTRLLSLVFYHAPAALIFFYGGTALAAYIVGRTRLSAWASVACLFGIMVALFILAFLLELWRIGDYPTMPGSNMAGFLSEYLGQWRVYVTR